MKFFCNLRFNAILLLSGLFLFSFGEVKGQCNHPDDIAGLTAIYNALDGQSWTFNNDSDPSDDWIPNCNGCDISQWSGINCNANGRVSNIYLGNATGMNPIGVSGDFPSFPQTMIGMEDIRIIHENLTGLPDDINLMMPSLKIMHFYDNDISGNIPTGISQLNNLEILWLSANNLSGSVPDLSQCNLSDITFRNNQLSGTIPPFFIQSVYVNPFTGDLSNLVDFSYNNLAGPLPSLSQLGNISTDPSLTLFVNFSDNDFDIPIPPSYGNDTRLEVNIANNKMTGCFDANLQNNPNLSSLLFGNNIDAGNCFDANWVDFINNSNGLCGTYSCSDPYYDNWSTQDLIDFYNSTGGNSWINKDGWENGAAGTSCNPCCWYGVTCDFTLGNGADGTIVGIDLSNNEVKGPFGDHFTNITTLEDLDLSGNELTGEIPEEYGYLLPNLNSFDVSNNNLSGCFAPDLEYICNITSNSTVSDGNSFEVEWDDFCNTDFGGCCDPNPHPDLATMEQFYDDLTGDSWTINTDWKLTCDPCDWFGVTCDGSNRVIEIKLSSNNLSGFLPILSDLEFLQKLEVRDNNIGFLNPSTFNNLSFLSHLDLGNNNLGDLGINGLNLALPPLPPILPLEYLYLDENEFINSCNLDYANYTNLKVLNLSRNNLTGTIPQVYGSFPSLLNLSLNENNLTGDIPSQLSNLSNTLSTLRLQQNALSGCYHPDLDALCSVTSSNAFISLGNSFDADWTDFCASGDGACCDIVNHPDYEALEIFYADLQGDTWINNTGWFDNCEPCNGWFGVVCNSNDRVVSIELPNNNLNGQIPISTLSGDITFLQDLKLRGNNINGSFDFSNYTSLKHLDLGENDLGIGGPTGLPSYSNLPNLEYLYLDNNGIIAPLNINMNGGGMPSLQVLNLSQNNLFGGIPISIGSFPALQNLSLNNNTLSLTLPSQLSNLSNTLTILRLQENSFSGCYNPALDALCSVTSIDGHISTGNSFDATWSEFCTSGNGACCDIVNHPDYDALEDFYNDLDGDNWTDNTGWLDNCDPCNGWYGITCNGNGRVVELNLFANGLNGDIGAYLGDLTELEEISLNINSISGSLPNIFSNLPSLTRINFSNNDLTGSIPLSMMSLPNLDWLTLDANDLSGTIPLTIAGLSNLRIFSLANNNISGGIPSGLGAISTLENIILEYNNLSGGIPSTFGNLTNTALFLSLNNNSLTGCFDPNLYSICGAGSNNTINVGNSFDMQWEDFCLTNSMMCSQSDVQYLMDLYTSTNGSSWTDNTGWIDGAAGTNCDPCGVSCDSPWFGITCNTAGQVTEIDLIGNNLSGTLPNTLHNLPFLEELALTTNNISGSIPSLLGTSSTLSILGLAENLLTGDIPSNLSGINFLLLSENQFTGSIPASFASGNIQILLLRNNELCGCYDSSLSALCTSLGGIGNNQNISDGNNFDAPWEDFCGSGSTGECGTGSVACYHPDYEDLVTLYTATGGTSSWTNNQGWTSNCDPCGECGTNTPWYGITCVNNRVTEINLSNNGLIGTLPGNLDDLTELEKLIINNNQIGGELPPDYSNLTNLTQFTAAYNNFEGGIPTEYCAFVPQVNFTFSNNQLSNCYDPNLSCMCSIFSPNSKISNGNNFPVPFSAFCGTGDGDCSDNCMDFDGVDDRLSISSFSFPNNAFTINFWFKAYDNLNSAETRFISTAGNGSVFEIGIEEGGSSDGNLWIHDTEGTPNAVFATSTFVEDGEWHHLVVVRNGTSGEVYVDGNNIHSYTTTGFPAVSYGTTTIIGEYVGGGFNLQGQLDDIAIWDIALTQADITEMQTCELNGSEGGLVSFWDFNVGISEADNNSVLVPNIPDQTGNGNDLTISNFTRDGAASNLVTSTTGVYDNCNICYASPISVCQSGLTFTINEANPEVTVLVSDIDNGSSSVCGGAPTLSFDIAGTITTLTYDCMEPSGLKSVDLYVTDGNGLQASCSATFTLEKDLQEYEALEAIYNSTAGTGWITNTGWLTNCDPCDAANNGANPWYGVTCDANHEHVIELELHQNNLVGTLPSEIGDLDSLERLELTMNTLSGLLPLEICTLENLDNLLLGKNMFSGALPICLLNLESLKNLYLNDNLFTGPLPAFNQADNPDIVQLNFSNNVFTDSIPPSYGLLDDISYLFTFGNDLSGCYHPNHLNLCSQLNSTVATNAFISDGNSFDNPWEDFCGKSYELALLADFYHSTSGNGWSNTQANDRPWFENCDPCDIANSGANPWFGLVCNANDEILQINMPLGNNLNGVLPTSIGDFPALNWIALSGNPGLEGAIPTEICDLVGVIGPNGPEGLRVLQLTGSNLTGEIPSCIADLYYLEFLALSENNGINGSIGIFGPLPAFDQDNTLLQTISIYNTHVSGTIPQDYVDLPSLTSLQLQFNYLTGTIPPIGTNQPGVSVLSFHGNYFDGSIPGIFGSLTQLNQFDVYGNQGSFSYTDPNGNVVSGGSLGLSGCYGPLLNGLCQNTNLSLTDNNINNGNPLLGSWEDYCLQGIDRCCPDELIIDWAPVLDGTYRSFGDIILQSQIAPSANVTLSHGTDPSNMVNLIGPVTLGSNSNTIITPNGCNN